MKLTSTILSISLYLLAPTSAFGRREFKAASSYTVDAPNVKTLDAQHTASAAKATTLLRQEQEAENVFEITNNSADTVDVLSIRPLKIILRLTPSALTNAQISTMIVTMQDILISEFQSNMGYEPADFTLISAVGLNDDVLAKFVPAHRMLRNGRALVDGGTTAASSVIKISGGYANVTFSVDTNPPSESVLNEAVVNILNNRELINNSGLGVFGEVSVMQFPVVSSPGVDPTVIQPDGRNMSIGTSATLGAMAAIIVAAGAGFFAWKKGVTKKISERYRDVRSSLRMVSSHKRLEPDSNAQDYLVEVCTDATESPISSPKLMPSNDSDLAVPTINENCPSPSSVRSEKQRAGDKKTIDPADYVVEVGTE